MLATLNSSSKEANRKIGQNLTIISNGSTLKLDEDIAIKVKGKMKYKDMPLKKFM